MTWFATKQNKYIVEGTAFELDGVQYPAVWLNQATAEQKAALGLQEVIATDSPKDDRFYWVSEQLNGASLTYVNTPKDLDTLKSTWTTQVKQTTYTILQPTDYIDTRNLRDPNYKIDWMMWRDLVLKKCEQVVLAIADCTTVDELAVVVTDIQWPHDPSYVPPVVQAAEV